MPPLSRCVIAVVFGLVLLIGLPAQSGQETARTPRQSDQQQPRGISNQAYPIDKEPIRVFCSVWNKNTKSFVTNLSREDFLLYEDGKKQEITDFAPVTNMPLMIALLMDTSMSVAPRLQFEQDAAVKFFYNVMRETDRAMIVGFGTDVNLIQDFTNNTDILAKRIREIQAAGSTCLYDAIVKTYDQWLIRETGRKIILILSDGSDSSSVETIDHARERARTADATIFSISSRSAFFGVNVNALTGDEALTRFATESGGRLLKPFRIEELDSAFKMISNELRSQYTIGYHSTNPLRDGRYRKIEIKTADKNLQVNCRKGYTAPRIGN